MDYEGLLDRLNLYLSEPIEDAASRASSEFDQFSRSCENRLILFGAGKIGRQVLSALRNDKITPLAFSDNNPQLWGELVDGLLVISPEEAAATVSNGTLAGVAFGHHYISNPDLVERVKASVPLVEPDARTFYSPGAKGYTDYPALTPA